jgi:hypothetical protein
MISLPMNHIYVDQSGLRCFRHIGLIKHGRAQDRSSAHICQQYTQKSTHLSWHSEPLLVQWKVNPSSIIVEQSQRSDMHVKVLYGTVHGR